MDSDSSASTDRGAGPLALAALTGFTALGTEAVYFKIHRSHERERSKSRKTEKRRPPSPVGRMESPLNQMRSMNARP